MTKFTSTLVRLLPLGELSNPNPIQIVPADYIEGTQVIDVGADSGLSIEDIYTQFSLKANNGIQWKLTKDGIILEPDTVGASTAANLGTLLATLEKNDSDTPYKIAITDKTSSFTTTNDSLTETLDDYGKYVKLSFSNASFTSMAGTLSEFVTGLTIPASVTDVGFIDAGEFFSSFTVASGNTTYTASSGILYANNGNKIVRYPPATTATTVNIPSNITAIADGAFVGCKNIEAFTVSSGNSYFKAQPSMDWDNLATSYTGLVAYQELNFFKKDETLGSAPSDINSEEFTIWQRKANAQYNHYGYATIPVLTSYDETTLIACPPAYKPVTQAELQNKYPGASNSSAYTAYTPKFNFDAVRPYAFGKCDSLTSVYLTINNTPESTEYTFYKCANMTGIDFNCNTTTISPYTFTGCTALSWVNFNNSTTTIVKVNALAGCTALNSLYFQSGLGSDGKTVTVKDGAYPSTCNVQITGYVA